MPRIILPILAAVTAYWLAPHAHVLTQKQRYVETAAVIAVFFVINFALGRARAARRPASRPGSGPYAAPAKRR